LCAKNTGNSNLKQEMNMKNTMSNIAKFLTIGVAAVLSGNALAASYQVIEDPVKETKWYESNSINHITVKTTNEAIIVLQQAYRHEDFLTVVPAHSEKRFEYIESFSDCFRFIDTAQKVNKQCFTH
jgi:hypothetical protein